MPDISHNQIERVASVLKRIQTKGENISGNVAILIVNDARNYYIQFAAGHDETPDGRDPRSLYAEAVGNEVLSAEAQLSQSQRATLVDLGWHPPRHSPNYSRSWTAVTDHDRRVIATRVLETMYQVYGLDREGDIQVQVMIA
jgi:hypothetical protein